MLSKELQKERRSKMYALADGLDVKDLPLM